MKVAIFASGTELTRGELVNSNAAWLSERVTELGGEVIEHVAVDDDLERIQVALRRLSTEVDAIISTGGLGPTTDDLTTEAIAGVLGVPCFRDENTLDRMRARFAKFNRVMSPSNEKQADFPQGSAIILNEIGTAPGYRVLLNRATLFVFPGVPREMKPMFEQSFASSMAIQRTSTQLHLRTFGLPESAIGDRLAGLEAENPGVTIGYRAHFPEVEVKVFARADSEASALTLATKVAERVHERLAPHVYGGKADTLPKVLLREMQSAGKTLAIAESCTGGLVGHLLTHVPGSSKVLLADVVAYSNEAKTLFLGVPSELIAAHGAVSEPVACAMARGVREKTGATVGLAITGVAGPDGGSEEKPVGTVFLAVSTSEGEHCERRMFPWHRDFIQTIAAHAGLWKVRASLSQ
jgi:nicotinamide-nucleotide amidase